jgi:hypothetical protein
MAGKMARPLFLFGHNGDAGLDMKLRRSQSGGNDHWHGLIFRDA